MTVTRAVGVTLEAFLVSQVLAGVVHGFLLASDYAPFYGTLLRGGAAGPSWQMLFLPVAHLAFVGSLVWVCCRASFEGSPALRGLKIGTLAWLMGQVPLWLVWYAEQPWPGNLVVKQLAYELLSSFVIGLTIAFLAPRSDQSLGAARTSLTTRPVAPAP